MEVWMLHSYRNMPGDVDILVLAKSYSSSEIFI